MALIGHYQTAPLQERAGLRNELMHAFKNEGDLLVASEILKAILPYETNPKEIAYIVNFLQRCETAESRAEMLR